MDAFHRYTRPPHPPPPSAEDPHYHQYHHQQQLLPGAPPTPPSQAPWYANQFQYNASNSQSPSTPPPWPQPPPHANHLNPPMLSSAYPPPPPPPYPGYKPPAQGQFPPRPFPPPPPPQHLNSYPPQEWNNSNWAHQQHWNHPAHNDTEDWAARAKAWATAKASTENHPQQGHYAPSGRQEEQNHYQIQYAQTAESQYTENHQRSPMMSGYPQHPVSTPRPPGQPTHFQEHASTSAGSSSYVPDGSLTYSATEGASNGDQNVAFHPQPLPANPLIHQQEVPSSYSSVSGKEETDQIERRADIPVPAIHEAMHHLHAPIPIGRGMTFPYANHDSMTNLADKPLEFTSRFNHDQNSVPQSGYAYHDSSLPVRGADADIVNTWNSSMAPNVPYSSVPPHFPSVPQHDASIHGLASFSGHSAPPFPRFAGPNFQPTAPSPGGPFVPGAGPPPGFSADAYNLPGISERPKKVPVPNWLREEIIKTKASVTSSSAGHPKYEAQFAEDEGADKSFEKGDQEDSKSIESSRSTEEDDEDEDYVEAAKTAAINQEIKRILTEVLLKVTDELFDEIATKVLNEDDAAADGYKVSPTIQAASTTKASGEGPIFVETKELKKENDSQKSSSSSAGNILGLANYASDDDNNDEEEIHSSKQSDSIKQTHHVESGDEKRLSALHNASENGTSVMKVEEHDTAQANVDRYSQRTSTARNKDSTSNSKMEEPYQLNSPKGSSAAEFGKVNYKRSGTDGQNASRPKELTGLKHNLHDGDVDVRKSLTYNSRDTESMMKSSRKDGTENSSGVESSKEPQSKEDVKLDENHKSKDDKHVRKEKTENYDSEDTKKDCDNVKDGDKIEESEGRKRSNHPDEREDRKGRERSYRENAGDDRRIERVKDKEEDKHRHKSSHDVSKHKRRRSSSTSSRGRISKDYEVSHAKNSSDGTSDDSRRKGSSRKRNLSRSPSPAKSRRRQVSRSPTHSKHSQRRHSPYSSLDSSRRKRRSRSRSPVRRPR